MPWRNPRHFALSRGTFFRPAIPLTERSSLYRLPPSLAEGYSAPIYVRAMWHLYSTIDQELYYLASVLEKAHAEALRALYIQMFPNCPFIIQDYYLRTPKKLDAYDFVKYYRAKFFLHEVINNG